MAPGEQQLSLVPDETIQGSLFAPEPSEDEAEESERPKQRRSHPGRRRGPAQADNQDNTSSDDEGLPAANLEPGNPRKLVSQSVFRKDILPSMLQRAESIAEGKARTQIDEAAKAAEKSLTTEIERLRELSSRNSQISSAEIADLTDHRDELIRILGQSRLRLDALRLIWRAPG